ncbi:MAG: TonB-dependent receptor, partial [Halobacteriovoraceae bacterium]|nr:TonB-dependent receptor [Halobacteriovoraceae bacterium]
GTFAEIGAGQEVARNFFTAGAAAGTIAKTMSAYDMKVSDDIYGKSKRYVSKERLETMLNKEFNLVVDRLKEQRDEDTQFFAFADTVAAKSYGSTLDGQGWLGVRFQHYPAAEYSQIILHVKMKDKENLQQQEALGIMGVNIIYACFYHLESSRREFTESLMDGLSTERIEIDMISIEGPAYKGIDSRLASLELVKRDFCQAIMFDENGNVCQPSDALYKKNILVCRGSFRPPTLVNMDMIKAGVEQFQKEVKEGDKDNILVLPEISMNKLLQREGKLDNEDFLSRVNLLNEMGHKVLITRFQRFHELSMYLGRATKLKIGFVLGVFNLADLFSDDQYINHPYGLLGALGNLVGHHTSIYVYPQKDDDSEKILNFQNASLPKHVQPLLDYLCERKHFSDLTNYDKSVFGIWSRTVLSMIQTGEEGWEKMVPKSVANSVKEKKLFGYTGES